MRTLVLLVAAALAAGPTHARPGSAAVTAISHVAVVDVETGRILPDQNVLIEGRRIGQVGPASTTPIPPGAATVDGRGKWLIPGLWDMHVHLSVPGGEALLSLYPIHGVTGVRDMNDSFPEVAAWRRRISAGELVGPRIVASGPYLVGGRPPLPHLPVKTAAEGRAGVDSLKALGVDFVKVHNGLPREAYFAIADRVRELGWTFAGHVPQGITVIEAADAGQRSLEHMTGFTNRCTEEEAKALKPSGLITFLLGGCDQTDLAPTIARLKANGTWVDPTLIVNRAITRGDTIADSTDRYRNEGLRNLQTVVMRLPPMDQTTLDAARFLLRRRFEVVGRLAQAGVPILVGSDAPTPGTFPGFSTHDEMAVLVRAGLTPLQALQGATLEPARYFGGVDSLGTVAPGKLADLVLLEGNPIDDIANTRRIAAVWTEGRLIDGAGRRRLLEATEAAAKR